MNRSAACLPLAAALLALSALGCASAARDTTGFALNTTGRVAAPLDETWQAFKATLRERELEIYTRDKRGLFVAYRSLADNWIRQERIQYTIELVPEGGETEVYIETLRQVYGVTLLTYPDWHDRPTEDEGVAEDLLATVQARIAAPPADAPGPVS